MAAVGNTIRCGASAALSLIVFAFTGGCTQQPYLPGYAYDPQPAVVEVFHRVGTTEQTPLTVLASVLGVRRANAEKHLPTALIVRLRLEVSGPSPVNFDPNSLELVTGTLRAFPPPQVNPPNLIPLSPGQRQDVMAYFAFPPNATPGDMNLNHLRLRWEVLVDNVPVQQTAIFQRAAGDYQDNAYDADVY